MRPSAFNAYSKVSFATFNFTLSPFAEHTALVACRTSLRNDSDILDARVTSAAPVAELVVARVNCPRTTNVIVSTQAI